MSPADLLYPIAVGLGEGGWIAVLYLLVDTLSKVDTPLGLAIFAVVAAGVCAAADRLDRWGLSRTTLIIGLTVGGAVVGLLATPAARAALVSGDIAGALGADPGGALVGLAALRGFLRGGAVRDPEVAIRPVWIGTIGLAIAWIFAGVLLEPGRSEFRAAALAPTLSFLFGSLAAAGLARTELAAAEGRFRWDSNRPWLIALIGVLAAFVLAAVPIGRGTERMIAAIIAWPLSLPVAIVALVIIRLLVPGRRRAARQAGMRLLVPVVAFVVLAIIAVILPRGVERAAGEADNPAAGLASEPTSNISDLILLAIAILIVVATLLFLARAWGGARRPVEPGRQSEIRRIAFRDLEGDQGGDPGRRWLRFLPRRQGRPGDAVAAYLAALRELAAFPDLQRADYETPARHARRLRHSGTGSLELELLAADYELARWGARRITPPEDQRAIGRWARLRAGLPVRDHGPGKAGPGDVGPRIRTQVHGSSRHDALATGSPDE